MTADSFSSTGMVGIGYEVAEEFVEGEIQIAGRLAEGGGAVEEDLDDGGVGLQAHVCRCA